MVCYIDDKNEKNRWCWGPGARFVGWCAVGHAGWMRTPCSDHILFHRLDIQQPLMTPARLTSPEIRAFDYYALTPFWVGPSRLQGVDGYGSITVSFWLCEYFDVTCQTLHFILSTDACIGCSKRTILTQVSHI